MAKLHKMVNGKRVDLTPDEEAAVRAEWAENSIKAAADQKTASIEQKRTIALKALDDGRLEQEAGKGTDAIREVKEWDAARKA